MKSLAKAVVFALFVIPIGFWSANANASVIYKWVCDAADCNGDPAFRSVLEISDSAFAAGDFTGVSGNVLSWDTASGVGDGFSLSLADILTGPVGSNTDDDDNLRIVLTADGSEVSDLLDISAGTNITFNSSEGRVDFFEGTGGAYSVGSLRDGPVGSPSSDIVIMGRFVRVVPEPASTVLFLLGVAGLAFAGLRSRAD